MTVTDRSGSESRSRARSVRDFTLQAFKDLGYEGVDAHTNCIFIDLERLAKLNPKTGEVKEWPSPSGARSHPYAIEVVDDII